MFEKDKISNLLILLKDCPVILFICLLLFVLLTIFLAILLITLIIGLIRGRGIKIGFITINGKRENISNEIRQKQDKFENYIATTINKLYEKIDYVERLAILPNFRIPPSSSLKKISSNIDMIHKKNILIKFDLEIPSLTKNDININHYKFKRATETLALIYNKAHKIIVAYSQGGVRLDIANEGYHFDDSHPKRLISFLNDSSINYKILNSLDDIPDFYASEVKIAFLKNIVEIFPEEKRELDFISETSKQFVDSLCKYVDLFILDDFRKSIYKLPLNTYISSKITSYVGIGLENDIKYLESLVKNCIKYGREGKKRIAICGSMRPYDLHIIKLLLHYNLFDKILLGVYPALPFQICNGINISKKIEEKLISLCSQKNESFERIKLDVCKFCLEHYREKLLMPKDYFVDGDKYITIKEIINYNESISIGTQTIKQYVEECQSAFLVFHFGMLSPADEKLRWVTKEIINAYKSDKIVSYTAGDHIGMLAQDLGFTDDNTFFITGAQTTSCFLGGVGLIGLQNFFQNE